MMQLVRPDCSAPHSRSVESRIVKIFMRATGLKRARRLSGNARTSVKVASLRGAHGSTCLGDAACAAARRAIGTGRVSTIRSSSHSITELHELGSPPCSRKFPPPDPAAPAAQFHGHLNQFAYAFLIEPRRTDRCRRSWPFRNPSGTSCSRRVTGHVVCVRSLVPKLKSRLAWHLVAVSAARGISIMSDHVFQVFMLAFREFQWPPHHDLF